MVLEEDGVSHIGDIYVSVCPVCYSCHYVVFDLGGTELSEGLELGFDCLADAIRCLLDANDTTTLRKEL